MSLNWNSNHTALIIQTKQVHDFIQVSTIPSETLFNIVVATITPGVSQWATPAPSVCLGFVWLEGWGYPAYFGWVHHHGVWLDGCDHPYFLFGWRNDGWERRELLSNYI
jgi:hypothetical protein